jgi:hypothetical protein
MAGLSHYTLVLFVGKPGAALERYTWKAFHSDRLTLVSNIRLGWKSLPGKKHSSLIFRSVNDEEIFL